MYLKVVPLLSYGILGGTCKLYLNVNSYRSKSKKNVHEKASLKSRQNPVQDSRLSKSNIFVRLRHAVLDRVDNIHL